MGNSLDRIDKGFAKMIAEGGIGAGRLLRTMMWTLAQHPETCQADCRQLAACRQMQETILRPEMWVGGSIPKSVQRRLSKKWLSEQSIRQLTALLHLLDFSEHPDA